MTPDNLESIKRRRQAIKIVAGVPTIFTLASGSVSAAESVACHLDPRKEGTSHFLEPVDPSQPMPVEGDVPSGRIFVERTSTPQGTKDLYVTQSCWTSLNVTSIKDGASTRIA